jgi:hypothetical protein
MSENIVDLDEHRFKDMMQGVALTVVGPPFEIEGVPMSLTWNMEVRNGDYGGSIEEIRKAGGIYIKRKPSDVVTWFLPWSNIAAIRIIHFE